jgi:hypothetical protein
MSQERCKICGCKLHRSGTYATPTIEGRSHATEHHYVAERFFGRSKNRGGEQRLPLFLKCPWELERKSAVYCYDCHEVVLHNPVFTPENIRVFAELVRRRGLNEDEKEGFGKQAGRVKLLHEVIKAGLAALNSPRS